MKRGMSSLAAAALIAALGSGLSMAADAVRRPAQPLRGDGFGGIGGGGSSTSYRKRTPRWTNASFRRAAAKKQRVKAARRAKR
jgi:hypothetical protein